MMGEDDIIMENKIVFTNYLGAFATFLIYFATVYFAGAVFEKNGGLNKWALVLHCLVLLVLFVGTSLKISIDLTKIKGWLAKETIEKLSPKIDIKLFPFPEQAITKYKYPLKQYVLTIQNLNKQSPSVSDFRIEFIFNNVIEELKQMPLIESGGNLSVSGVEIYEEKKDGTIFHYEEQPLETRLTENFSLDILKAKVNGKEVNTNIAILTCERWPENVSFSGKIIVDLSKKPEILKKPDMMGKYEGAYSYKIQDKQFSKKISGVILQPNINQDTIAYALKREYWEKALSKIDPNEGTIFYRTHDDKWLEENNYFIEFIPHIKKDNFELHVYRDKDNVFKVLLSNSFSKGVVLKFKDLDRLRKSSNHPNHGVAITWGKGENKLYLDGVLIDSTSKDN